MKKFILAIVVLLFSAGVTFAQTTKPAKEKAKTTKKAAAATTATPAAATAAAPTAAPAASAKPVKKDGTPDKRFKENKHTKKDGTADKRFKENKKQ
ncbi:MAG: hypothetical protein QM802_06495 [Agriterribacter sp.]